eukprot:TRINITY_DN29103_c1_g1_i1.p1 TRINITY_DN29103_c1_g1~~TRINITY_DN29103_c1_g1_i1.p1  ORF type:complete len:162 (-),score=26.00 TRINITY_DN29103_c1_g1_i1:378-863(-)
MCSTGVMPDHSETLREIISRYGVFDPRAADDVDIEFNHDFQNASSVDDERVGADSNQDQDTTLMLRNIPCKVQTEWLQEELRKLGFEGTYDVIHIPTRKNKSNLGYGFINFISPEHARRFADAVVGHMFSGSGSVKRCYVTKAAFQGREAALRGAASTRTA